MGVYIAHKVPRGGTMVGWRRSSPVFVEKGLSRLASQPKAAKAQAIAERVVLPRPEGTSENSRGQRPWKTTAPRWSSPDGARERRVGPVGFARSYRACPRTVLYSRGVAPGYFRLPFQGSVGRKTGYPVGETDKCAERRLFWNLDMHPKSGSNAVNAATKFGDTIFILAWRVGAGSHAVAPCHNSPGLFSLGIRITSKKGGIAKRLALDGTARPSDTSNRRGNGSGPIGGATRQSDSRLGRRPRRCA